MNAATSSIVAFTLIVVVPHPLPEALSNLTQLLAKGKDVRGRWLAAVLLKILSKRFSASLAPSPPTLANCDERSEWQWKRSS